MTGRQKLPGVQIPFALPFIMASINQTIMMSIAMVVIASLVPVPGPWVLVLRGVRNNPEPGVGFGRGRESSCLPPFWTGKSARGQFERFEAVPCNGLACMRQAEPALPVNLTMSSWYDSIALPELRQ